jgi:hypothetical protein
LFEWGGVADEVGVGGAAVKIGRSLLESLVTGRRIEFDEAGRRVEEKPEVARVNL